jgi:hypothetical protein
MGGLVAGHAVDYVVTFPSASHRHSFLELSGHAHMHTLRPISIGLAVLAAIFSVWRGSREGKAGGRGSYIQYAIGLIAFQTVGFLGMEIVERTSSGTGLASLPIGLLALGVVIQVVIALVAALVLVGLEAFGAALARHRLARLVSTTNHHGFARLAVLRSAALEAARPRGPPAVQLT